MNWESVHIVNFKCSIDTRLRSFYFKLLKKSIALNYFLFRKCLESPLTNFYLICSYLSNITFTYVNLRRLNLVLMHLSYIKIQKDTEYHLAKKRGKLSIHFKKWKFEL